MNSHSHQSQSIPSRYRHHSSQPTKKGLAGEQLQILESSFNANKKLQAAFKLELAHQLGVPPRQIAIWYQNRRAKHRAETKEHECMNIQQKLGNALAEKIKLEKEVCMLKYELHRAQEMLIFASTSSAATLLSGSTSDDDHATSYSHANLTYAWVDISKVLPGEELYSNCLTGPVSMLEKYTNSHSLLAESKKHNHDTSNDYKM